MKSKNIVVYSCSGCSNVAQLANTLAIRLHREKKATMSCIAGVGGDVPSLVKTATSAEKILALDGCPLACVSQCLKRHGIAPDAHVILTEYGLLKKTTEAISDDIAESFYDKALDIIDELKAK